MRRRRFLALSLVAVVLPVRGQPKVARIGFLWTSAIEPKYRDAFVAGMRENTARRTRPSPRWMRSPRRSCPCRSM
jgi:hypothetical protein